METSNILFGKKKNKTNDNLGWMQFKTLSGIILSIAERLVEI